MRKIERIIVNKSGLTTAVRKTKQLHLPGFEGQPVFDVINYIRKQVTFPSLFERAAAISYNLIMAIPPSLLFLITLIPNLPFVSQSGVKEQLHQLVFEIVPSKTYNENIILFIDNFFDETKVGILSFGFVLALLFSSNAMIGIMRSFNRKYEGFKKWKGLKRRITAIKLTLIIFGLLLGYLVLVILQGKLLDMLVQNETLRNIISYSRWFLILALAFFSISFIYRHAPSMHKHWKFFNPGAVVATILSVIANLFFTLYVMNFGEYNALYGAIGTVMMLMALIFVNALALLIGFELNVGISSLKAKALRRAAAEEEIYGQPDGIFE